jgi:hypothetical protein
MPFTHHGYERPGTGDRTEPPADDDLRALSTSDLVALLSGSIREYNNGAAGVMVRSRAALVVIAAELDRRVPVHAVARAVEAAQFGVISPERLAYLTSPPSRPAGLDSAAALEARGVVPTRAGTLFPALDDLASLEASSAAGDFGAPNAIDPLINDVRDLRATITVLASHGYTVTPRGLPGLVDGLTKQAKARIDEGAARCGLFSGVPIAEPTGQLASFGAAVPRPDAWTDLERVALWLRERVASLSAALTAACAELDEHAREYQHRTPGSSLAAWRALVEGAA